jgi:ComF family protein
MQKTGSGETKILPDLSAVNAKHAFLLYNALISKVLNILYPSQCPACNNVSDVFHHSPICASCWSRIKRYSGPACKICAMPFTSEYGELCGQCLKKAPFFSQVMNYGLYEGVLSEAINHLKFYGVKRLVKPLSRLLFIFEFAGFDGIIPVPLSIRSLKERGFNQSLLISRVISKKFHVPLLMDNLRKTKETPPQIGLSARERLLNLKNAFEVRGNIKGLRLLLVDDVMTTGATVAECSKELLKAGAKEVIVLTLARTSMM